VGIPILEDKLVQAGLVRILEAVYEQDFIDDSYGFSALRVLSGANVENNPVNHIVEADIKGFSGLFAMLLILLFAFSASQTRNSFIEKRAYGWASLDLRRSQRRPE